MIKIGQIGKGNFGNKILSKIKLIPNTTLNWVCGSQDRWWEQESVDWVIIASPNEFHYEQAKYFLENNINVFCEKPGTLCFDSLKELIELSKKNDVYFYIDDVLIYENIKPTNHFIYKKWGGPSTNIIDRMAYHHFYLMFDPSLSTNISLEIKIIKNDNSHKLFELDFDGKKYLFEYDFNWFKPKIHNIEPQYNGDALEKMLKCVLFGKVDFSLNNQRSLFATFISEFVKKNIYGKCAVIGAGIYGITAAIKLKTIGFEVDIYESEDDIMKAASGINQYRIHRGYHYPRSLDTIESCKNNEQSFIKYYNQSIINGDIEHFYAIAKEDSLITPKQYLKSLDKAGLEWDIVDTLPNCDLTLKVNEKLYDPSSLKKICLNRIKGNGINLILNKRINIKSNLEKYKYKVYSTYASLNELTDKKQDYQFELCEKPLFKLPKNYKNKSIVIMDGPFMCFDPLADTEFHLGGNVVHAIHVRNVGKKPEIPRVYKEYLNKGLIKNPKYTNVNRFIESSKKFFPDIEQAKYIGSMYTIRTVLPNKDKTDERPTIVTQHNNTFVLFSGKVGNCVEASNKIIRLIKNEVN
tara:strand:+ start:9666 stop:11402 length:1737 start_codon:yes stop_codon:yes gene_type:complete